MKIVFAARRVFGGTLSPVRFDGKSCAIAATCRCSPGRNLKNLVIEYSSISGSPLSAQASKKYREGFMSLIGPKPAHTGSSRKRRMRVCGSKSCVALWPAGHSR